VDCFRFVEHGEGGVGFLEVLDMQLRIGLMSAAAIVLIGIWAPAAVAEPVTAERVATLSVAEQAAWQAYLARSTATAAADAAALDAEVAASGMTSAMKAPDGGDFKVETKPGDPWFASPEAGALADVVISYQAPSGGWSKHIGYSRGPRKPGTQWSSQYEPGHSPHYLGTFDNRSTTEQLQYLAKVWQATQRDECQAAFVKGLRYVLAAQYPNGGWPQVYPLEGDYHDCVTLNDDAIAHILDLLYGIEKGEPRFAFLGEVERQQASAALKSGLQCVATMQVQQGGKKTGWCAQHDAITLKPTGARAMEPATLSGLESARLVKFLMTMSQPSPELTQVIEDGLAWLDAVKVTGLTKTKVEGKTAYVADPASTEIYWARFYDLATSKPVFPGRDGVLYPTFEAMAAKNKLGYDFYTTLPGSIVTNGQKKWRKMLAKEAGG
jgi:PelA/Pel-15E family pectate lyase